MGEIINAVCRKCGNRKELYIGVGRRLLDLEAALENYGEETQRSIKESLKDGGEAVSWGMENKIAHCVACGKIEAVPVLHVDAEGERKEFFPSCKCGGGVQVIDAKDLMEGEKITCPECGDGKLIFGYAGLWD